MTVYLAEIKRWQASFGLSLTQIGLKVTCFEGLTGFFQIPAGFLGERFGILLLTVLPLRHLYFFLPILGAALNGTSSVLYATVAEFVSPHRVARAFGLFYTFVIVAAAAAPPIMGRASDMLGLDNSMMLIGCFALSTVPMAFVLFRQTMESRRENQDIP